MPGVVRAREAESDLVGNKPDPAASVAGGRTPSGAVLEGDPAPLPSSFSASRVKRALIRLSVLAVIVVAAIVLLPGLGQLRDRFEHASAVWILIAGAFEFLSVLAYVPAFRIVFCKRMTWGMSYKIAMAEEGADSVLPIGGAGGLALGAWALRRGGMPTVEIARKTVAFFLLTSVPNVGTLVLVGLGLAFGVLPGHASLALTLVPAAVGAGAIAGTLALGPMLGRVEARIRERAPTSKIGRLAPTLRALADGVDDAVAHLRTRNPMLLVSLFGYMAFDILALWAGFRAFGSAPELTIVWIAYLIGQLGNLIPLPGGIGGVELGLIGVLVLYGLPAATSTAAVLLYRVLELWIPAMLAVPAFVQLRTMLRREAEAIQLCQPGDAVEIMGLGEVIASQSGHWDADADTDRHN